jgi:phycocyanobilin:ferredoxin oxidoreductase
VLNFLALNYMPSSVATSSICQHPHPLVRQLAGGIESIWQRHLDLELARIGKNLDILYCVMFPRVEYGLPVFGCDVVSGRGQVSVAMVDLSAGSDDGTLGAGDGTALSAIERPRHEQLRELPAVG